MRPSTLSLLLAAPLAAAASYFHPRPPPTPYLHPTVQAFIKVLGAGTPLSDLPYAKAREVFEGVQAPTNPSLSLVDHSIIRVPVPHTKPGSVDVHLFKPLNTTATALPTIVYYHGGGWILGSANTHRRLAFDLVNRTGYAVWFVQYTPSPESSFPQPITEAYAGLQYLIKHGGKYGLSTTKIALAGDSAGGAMAAAVTIKSLENNTPLPKVNVLFYPATDLAHDSPTYKTFVNGPGLTVKTVRWAVNAFVPKVSDRTNPLVSVLLAKDEVLKKFPETLTITAEVDLLRHEGEAFAEKLAKNGVKSGIVRVRETIHDFVLWNALADTPPTLAAIDLAAATIKRVLN